VGAAGRDDMPVAKRARSKRGASTQLTTPVGVSVSGGPVVSDGLVVSGGSVGRGGLEVRGGFGVGGVVEVQRARVVAGMVEVACEHGVGSVAVAHVVERAGVSRRTFYELFENREACFLAAFEDCLRRAGEHVLPAFRQDGHWVARVRSSLVALLEFLDLEPVVGRLLIVASLGGGVEVRERRRGVLAQINAFLDRGREQSRSEKESLPSLTVEGVVGGVLSILHARLSEPEEAPGSLLELTGPLMSMIVLPYLGASAARKELERPTPTPRTPSPRLNDVNPLGPLSELHMRLTYRTMRVLLAVAAHPGGSNRQIADAAGIADQGQISKLLARLHNLKLVENIGASTTRGEPNSWTLTNKGWELENIIQHNNNHT
jgi:AcrR family transcriptional regulator